MWVVDRLVLDIIAGDAFHKLPRAAADRIFAELFDTDLFNIFFRHQLAFLEDCPTETGWEMNVHFFRVYTNGVIVDDLDALNGLTQGFGPGGERLFRHRALEAKFDVVRGQWVAVVPTHIFAQIKSPAHVVR